MDIDTADLHRQFNATVQLGYTSRVSFKDGRVTKTIKHDSDIFNDSAQAAFNTIQREVCILQTLQRFNWCPRLFGFGPDFFTTAFVGYPLNRTNLPADIFEQAQNMISDMQSVGVAHNDILWPHDEHVINIDQLLGKLILGKSEVMVWNGNIALVDFGWGTINGSYSTCEGVSEKVPSLVKKLEDSKLPYILREFAKDVKDSSVDFEIHILVDWTSHYDLPSFTEHLSDTLHAMAIYEREALTNVSERLSILQEFYGVPVADDRFKAKHVVYVLKDSTPKYDWRQTTKGIRIVNTKMFDMKKMLRTSGIQIHATDNIQETMDNMKVLKVPYRRFARERHFSDFRDVFEALNSSEKFEYVVLRNFDGLPDEVGIDEHFDLDLLVNDYYTAKRLLDAASTTGQRTEDGLGRVQNKFKVADVWVQVDIRYVGDNYYDAKWEAAILSNRKMVRGFYVPDSQNFKYSLVYHATVHKSSVSQTYRAKFLQLFKTEKIEDLTQILRRWMKQRGYSATEPSDPSVPFLGGALL